MTKLATPFPAASLLGYPRIGRRRELKKAVGSLLGRQDRRRRP
jgi:hypothetical protein